GRARPCAPDGRARARRAAAAPDRGRGRRRNCSMAGNEGRAACRLGARGARSDHVLGHPRNALMRKLSLALVPAHLAFAAWHRWYGGERTAPVAPLPDGPAITLVSEVRDDPSAAAPAPAPVVASPPAGLAVPGLPAATEPAAERCVSVGPFRELSQAATAAGSLRAAGHAPTQRVAEGEIWVGYWVYLERIPTEEEAEAILADIREHGVTDSYVIPDNGGDNRVSLGVFSEIGRAG